jgi:Fe2+ or Zn2+ uptake regulation protein
MHIQEELVHELEHHLEEGHGFKPMRTEVLVVGVCDDCSRNPARPTSRRRVIDPHHRH